MQAVTSQIVTQAPLMGVWIPKVARRAAVLAALGLLAGCGSATPSADGLVVRVDLSARRL